MAVDIPETPIPQPMADDEGSSDDVLLDFLGLPKAISKESEPLAILPQPIVADSLDKYLEEQVLQEMYGTKNPSEYDRISLALKRKL